ncbi:hypothetical protein ATSB10_12730 [Dyella thiooxydans]|uniref:Uncharacterized protein n=1 Tax=Dyella thiooxydans TaxID=445710 RepID=A0A160N0A8_9GAMM|nr:hypothetical protein ATSB10_12730 [Dyella thiooxydans]
MGGVGHLGARIRGGGAPIIADAPARPWSGFPDSCCIASNGALRCVGRRRR